METDGRGSARYESNATRLVRVFPFQEFIGGIYQGETSCGRTAENPPAQAAQGYELEVSNDPVSEARAV